ncbi:cupin domain-containing protein [Thermoleophilia bacterium SCSIO 60948]|nr:cupin domain-containing protein [Thermoleophilia bacterium SCSIO 60948]
MQITRSTRETARGPSEYFAGDVWIDAIAVNPPPSRVQALNVHFAPGARTAWHTHPLGQVIHVLEGVGRVGREGEAPQEIRPGDSVYFEPGENHWHGAAPDRFMVHIAIQETGEDGMPVAWGEHVGDEDYLREPGG